ncbi:hypothetical protein HZ993_04125 [Rhodoferax sp. AJA081-3]|uniref:hypothetical protein n=1 Tax=Rhodoferax sp. AJA081-3 TaxID=2752316 RepID=UPI001ADED7BC|nr:hypothetical protein [Rhodoferax sp. AJA081-3]QTN29040.1 hypothetical protein HZ993_04125 [Rhodoferax sp. AJA081-3]
MSTIRILSTSILAATLLVQPAMAQNKAAIGKSVTEFIKVSQGLATSLADLSKRAGTASPNDKDMLKLVNTQLGLVDATADGVVALGLVAAEMRDASDLAAAKKQLTTRCTALKSLAEASGKYVGSLASNIAAVATAAEVNKARDLVVQMGQHALCNPGKA